MATYLIGYDLNKDGNGYSAKNAALIKLIEAEADGYWHHPENRQETARIIAINAFGEAWPCGIPSSAKP